MTNKNKIQYLRLSLIILVLIILILLIFNDRKEISNVNLTWTIDILLPLLGVLIGGGITILGNIIIWKKQNTNNKLSYLKKLYREINTEAKVERKASYKSIGDIGNHMNKLSTTVQNVLEIYRVVKIEKDYPNNYGEKYGILLNDIDDFITKISNGKLKHTQETTNIIDSLCFQTGNTFKNIIEEFQEYIKTIDK